MSDEKLEWIIMLVLPNSLVGFIGLFAIAFGTIHHAKTPEDFWFGVGCGVVGVLIMGVGLWTARWVEVPRCRVCFTRLGEPGTGQTINGQRQVCSVACAKMQEFLDESAG